MWGGGFTVVGASRFIAAFTPNAKRILRASRFHAKPMHRLVSNKANGYLLGAPQKGRFSRHGQLGKALGKTQGGVERLRLPMRRLIR